jgi:hypothetical protein
LKNISQKFVPTFNQREKCFFRLTPLDRSLAGFLFQASTTERGDPDKEASEGR